ncbi:MAG: hypothetical protein J7494_04315 [Sphingobium sp.]|nr:hypothetical protein [Sphingobium sp.]
MGDQVHHRFQALSRAFFAALRRADGRATPNGEAVKQMRWPVIFRFRDKQYLALTTNFLYGFSMSLRGLDGDAMIAGRKKLEVRVGDIG